jgi:hypothetical protein
VRIDQTWSPQRRQISGGGLEMVVNKQLINKIKSFIDASLTPKAIFTDTKLAPSLTHFEYNNEIIKDIKEIDEDAQKIKEFIKKNKVKGFRDLLFKFIDDQNKADAEVYKSALLDRRLFSKIRASEDYHPNKKTVIALSLALKLKLEQSLQLLKSAGYSLSDSSVYDLVIVYCIVHKIFVIDEVNRILNEFKLAPLGSLD